MLWMTTIITMTMIAVCPHGWVLLESMAVAVTMLSMVDACQSLWTIASRITISLWKMLGKSEEENVENSLLSTSPSNHLSSLSYCRDYFLGQWNVLDLAHKYHPVHDLTSFHHRQTLATNFSATLSFILYLVVSWPYFLAMANVDLAI